MKFSFDTASAMKALAFVAALVPLAVLAAGVTLYPHWLGANPATVNALVAAKLGL